MAKLGSIEQQYQDYIKSERWKCAESPTNAHHWVERQSSGIFTCKHCAGVRRFPRTFNVCMELTYGSKLPYISLKDEKIHSSMQNQVPMRGKRRK